jgi:hypothetical protein
MPKNLSEIFSKGAPKEAKNKAFLDKPDLKKTVDAKPKNPIKSVWNARVCVVDYGSFICLADKLSESFKETFYYTPTANEFYSIHDLVKADGLDDVQRVNDIFDPEFIKKIDLFVFPDIGYGGLQRYLRSIGKAVWGSAGMDELEQLRTKFLDVLKALDLPVIHTEKINGTPRASQKSRE